jgi:hypothetical protein
MTSACIDAGLPPPVLEEIGTRFCCAYEAIQAVLPGWWLFHAIGPEAVTALTARPPARTVVWLDEIQRYLDGARGLTAGTLRTLLNAGVVVVGTLWTDRFTTYTTIPTKAPRTSTVENASFST